jgi:hypothetical protein
MKRRAVEVHIVNSTDEPGGIGEPGTAGIAPALANAMFAATGQRIASCRSGSSWAGIIGGGFRRVGNAVRTSRSDTGG